MSTLSVATEVIKESWCKGTYKQELPEGESFCSMGAIMQADVLINGVSFTTASVDRKATRMLADVIVEAYRPELEQYFADQEVSDVDMATFPASSLVVIFNDEIAQSHDEVVAMFEKATAKFEELV